jgi:hypothetical protein
MSIESCTIRLRLALKVALGIPPESLVPNMIRATAGFTTRYSHASGVSPGRHKLASANPGLRTLSVLQPLRAAIEAAANGFAPRPFGPEKKLIAPCR